MVAVVFDERSAREHMREVGKWWWVPLVTGIVWLILAWILLSFDATTVWTVAIFTGIFLIFGGAAEFMMATVTPSWRWLHIVLGLLFIAFGTASFVWPQVTFVALAALISWVIMIAGVFHVVGASLNPAQFRRIVRGHLQFLSKHRGAREAERARRVMLWGLRFRGLLYRGERGRAFRETAQWLGSGKTATLLESPR